MKLVLCSFIIVAAYCGLSNGAINLRNVRINDVYNYQCELPRSIFKGKNYYFCVTDYYEVGDGESNGGSGEYKQRPWCNMGNSWNYCHGYLWEVEFCHSVISDLTNDYKVRSYAFVQDFLNYRTNYHRIIDSRRQASFKTNFTVVGDSETGYEVVVPEKIVGDPLSLERQIYEESMENLRQILAPVATGRVDLKNFWVRDVNGNNEDYCLVYNTHKHEIRTVDCVLSQASNSEVGFALVVYERRLN